MQSQFNVWGQRRRPPLAPVFSCKPYVYEPSRAGVCSGLTCRYVGGNVGNVLRRPPPNCCGACEPSRRVFGF
jgi:hypothetical protein